MAFHDLFVADARRRAEDELHQPCTVPRGQTWNHFGTASGLLRAHQLHCLQNRVGLRHLRTFRTPFSALRSHRGVTLRIRFAPGRLLFFLSALQFSLQSLDRLLQLRVLVLQIFYFLPFWLTAFVLLLGFTKLFF